MPGGRATGTSRGRNATTTTIAVCRATRNLYLGKESAGCENGIDGFVEGGRKRVYSSCAPADPRLMPLRAKAVEACRFVFLRSRPPERGLASNARRTGDGNVA
jgi:hypothetical protein